VFLYVVTYPRNKKETLDIKMYRKSEEKSINVAEVQRELKSMAVDCQLNMEGNVYTGDKWNTPIKIKDLHGIERDIVIGDKSNSRMCDYMDECEYKCYGGDGGEERDVGDGMNNSTYSLDFSKHDIKSVIKILKKIFKNSKEISFKLERITKYVQEINETITDKIIYKALYEMIEKEIEVVDIFNRDGKIIYRGKNYIFQPLNMSNTIPIIERKLPFRTRKRKITLDVILEGKEKKHKQAENQTTKVDKDLFIEFINKVEEYLNRIFILDKYKENEENEENIRVAIEEVYDRLEHNDKTIILKYILNKLMANKTIEISFDEETGLTKIKDGVSELMKEFNVNENESKILKIIFFVILSKKFLIVNDTLYFKISKKDTINYYKLEEDKMVKVINDELIDIKLNYVKILKNIKNNNNKKKNANTYCFMKEDKNGNIKLKILEKKEGTDKKKTLQSKGSSCSHSAKDPLKKILKNMGVGEDGEGKYVLCDKISFHMRKKELNKEDLIYFYGLDEYLELK
jgi:hypothetical protein